MFKPEKVRHLRLVPSAPPEQTPEDNAGHTDWINAIPDPDIVAILTAGVIEGKDAQVFMDTHPLQEVAVPQARRLTIVKPEASHE